MSQLIQFEGCTHYAVGIEEFEEMEAEIESLRAQVAEFEHSLQLQWDASRRAIKMWHDDGNDDMTWPRKEDLCVWLITRLADCQAELSALKIQLKPDENKQATPLPKEYQHAMTVPCPLGHAGEGRPCGGLNAVQWVCGPRLAPPTAASTTCPPAAAACDWLQTCPDVSALPTTDDYSATLAPTWLETWPKR